MARVTNARQLRGSCLLLLLPLILLENTLIYVTISLGMINMVAGCFRQWSVGGGSPIVETKISSGG